MSSLSEKLQSLGVTLGTKEISKPKPKRRVDFTIDRVLDGEWQSTPHGDTFVVERRYEAGFEVGTVPLRGARPPALLAAWAGAPSIADTALERFVFLDTETTGLVGGTGTYTFLVGLGRFEGDQFRLAQFFLRDPAEETAQLAALEGFLAPCDVIVSYNGKSFDMPLLNTRFTLNGWPPPLQDSGHIDLLHLARRMWGNRLPGCTLGEVEANILGLRRSDKDVSGRMVADLFFDYLHTQDARPLESVFYHNEMDVISLAALLNLASAMVADPLDGAVPHDDDLFAIGKFYADMGRPKMAMRILQRGLAQKQPGGKAYWSGVKQLSFLHKRGGNLSAAMRLWEQAAERGQPYAHVELAKVYEHRRGDFVEAARWTQAAIEIVTAATTPRSERIRWLPELQHRLERLERRMEAD